MYSPVHATAGLLIAAAIPNPVLGLPLALASHYLLDAIPHGDTGLGPWMTENGKHHRIITVESIDLGSAVLMVSWLVATTPGQPLWYVLAGAVAGILPDLLWGASFLLKKIYMAVPLVTPFFSWHDRVHAWGHAKPKYDLPYRVGLIYQGAILALVLLWRG